MTQEQKTIYLRDGMLALKQFIDPAFLQTVTREWDDFDASGKETLMTKEEPVVVFWRHVVGSKKKVRPVSEFPAIRELVFSQKLANLVKELTECNEIRLLETVIFSKPPQISNILNFHQDLAYFPFEPSNQVAVWIPLDAVDMDNGTLEYVLKSHLEGVRGSVDLHTNQPYKDETRPLIPQDPAAEGFEIYAAIGKPGDVFLHDGRTWHRSGPNLSKDRQRRGLTVRYLIGKTYFKPGVGSAGTFMGQVDVKPGDPIEGPAFPLL